MASENQIRVIRRRQLEARLGLARSTIYDLLRTDQGFPKPIKLGRKAVGWLEHEIDAWLAEQVRKTREGAR
jgi:prophage regulatory protein